MQGGEGGDGRGEKGTVTPAVAMTADDPTAVSGSRPGRLVFRNTLVNAFGGIAVLGLNFVIIAFAINHLGSSAYGVWVLALSFSITGGYLSVADLGLQQGIVKFVADASGAHRRDQIGEVVSSALAVLSGLAILAILILLVFAAVAGHLFNVPPDLQTPLRLLFLVLSIEAAVGLPGVAFVGVLEGLQRYAIIRLVDVVRQCMAAVLVLIVLTRHGGVVWFGAAMTAPGVMATAGYVGAAWRAVPELRVSVRLVSLDALRPLARFSAWLFIARIGGVVWRQMDKVIIAVLLTSTVLTGYEIAARIQGAAAFALAFTASAVVPATASLVAQGSVERLRDLLLRGTRYTMAVCLPATIAAMILARPLIVAWVGPDFADVATATQLFLAYQLTVSTASIANTMLVGLGRVRAVTLYATVAVLINLGVSVALVHPWGIKGVIAGTLIGYGITTPLYIRLVLHELGLGIGRFLRESILPVLPCVLAFAVTLELTRRLLDPTNLVTILAVCAPAVAVYVVAFARASMSPAERRSVAAFLIPARFSKSLAPE